MTGVVKHTTVSQWGVGALPYSRGEVTRLGSALRHGRAMVDDQLLDLMRVMDIVGVALSAALLGRDPNVAAAEILETKSPTARELAAARRENHELHGGGGQPEAPSGSLPTLPVPEDVAHLYRLIDDVLVAAERQFNSSP